MIFCKRCGAVGHRESSVACPYRTKNELLREDLQRMGLLSLTPHPTAAMVTAVKQNIRPGVRVAVMNRTSGLCWFCGDPATTIDHAIPLSHGGSGKPWNLIPACK